MITTKVPSERLEFGNRRHILIARSIEKEIETIERLYSVRLDIVGTVTTDVEADSKEQAIERAKAQIELSSLRVSARVEKYNCKELLRQKR